MKTTIKTVLVLLLSVMTFFSCSKDDDDDNVGSVRTELVGSWYSDSFGEGVTLESDGTGFHTDEGIIERFNWGVTSNILNLDYIDSEDFEEIPYKLIDNNTFSLTLTYEDTNEDFDVLFYRQLDNNTGSIRTELVGTWIGTFIDTEDNSSVNTTIVLNSDRTGSVTSVFNDEVYFDTIIWNSTTTILTWVHNDGSDDDVSTYNFITQNKLKLTSNSNDGFEVILQRAD